MATSPFRNEVAILLYHRVYESPVDPQLLCVSPKHFAEHMGYLRRRYTVMSIRELSNALEEGRLPKRAVVVTFDDGYADNLWYAKPVLERYEIPATAFVTAGHVGENNEFWWHEVERLLLFPGKLPQMLTLRINGEDYVWDLGKYAEYSPSDFELHHSWHVQMEDDPTPRQRIYRDLCNLLRPLAEPARGAVLGELRYLVGMDGGARSDYRALSHSELVELARDGLVDIGAHTLTHVVLSTLSIVEQRREIIGSKQRLEEILGHQVVQFSYPYGAHSDYTPETIALLREAGFETACSNFSGTVGRNSDPFQLSRFLARDWTGEEFARRLKRWFGE